MFAGKFTSKLVPENINLIPSKAENKILSTLDIEFDKNSYSIAKRYFIALTDSTVEFNHLPSYRSDIPLSIITLLHSSVKINKIEITGTTIELYCTITSPSDFNKSRFEREFEKAEGIKSSAIITSGEDAIITLTTTA